MANTPAFASNPQTFKPQLQKPAPQSPTPLTPSRKPYSRNPKPKTLNLEAWRGHSITSILGAEFGVFCLSLRTHALQNVLTKEGTLNSIGDPTAIYKYIP